MPVFSRRLRQSRVAPGQKQMILSRGANLAFPKSITSDPLSWSTTSADILCDEVLPGLAVWLPLGLVSGLTCKRMAVQFENLPPFRSMSKYPWLQSLISSLCTCLTADLLVELCLLGRLGRPVVQSARWLFGKNFHGPIAASIPGSFIRLALVWIGIRLGENFVPIALTGSIATGKSTVSRLLSSSIGQPRSFHIVDTDAIGHEILLPSHEIERIGTSTVSPSDSVFEAIVAEFGDGSVNNKNILNDSGLIERRKLGDHIFKDNSRRRALNRITHPKITLVLLKQLVAHLYYSSKRQIVVVDVPLLYESKTLVWLFALKVVVACLPEIQLERLRRRNTDLTEQQCRERIASQIHVETKAAMADVVIQNNGSQEDLKREIHDASRQIAALLQGKSILPLSTFVGMIGSLWIVMSVVHQ
jgi:dephospho-CoA kinase